MPSSHLLRTNFPDEPHRPSNPKGFYVVGTDGKHLYSANSFTLPLKNSILIPNHKFLGWKEFNHDGEWQMKADDQSIQLSSRRWRFITRQIEGKYPDWRAPIPNPADATTVITFDPAKLETLIKLIQRIPCHDDRHHTLGLEWKGGQFMLLGKDKPQEDWLRVPVPDIQGRGSDVTVFLDRNYLTKALGYGLNTLSLISAVAPIRLHNGGKQLIVMPVRANATEPASASSRPAPPPAVITAASAPQPPPKAEQPTTTTPMIHTPTSEGPPPNGPKTTLEECIDLSLAIRDKFNDGFNLLRDLGLKLKLRQQLEEFGAGHCFPSKSNRKNKRKLNN